LSHFTRRTLLLKTLMLKLSCCTFTSLLRLLFVRQWPRLEVYTACNANIVSLHRNRFLSVSSIVRFSVATQTTMLTRCVWIEVFKYPNILVEAIVQLLGVCSIGARNVYEAAFTAWLTVVGSPSFLLSTLPSQRLRFTLCAVHLTLLVK